jgi:two-component system, OmpR family, sensor kinase
MLSRVPIRLRVTAAFAAAMALLLVALGAFLWFELRDRLDETIDDTLRSRLGEVSALAGDIDARAASYFGDEDETFLQVMRPGGTLAYTSVVAGSEPLLDPAQIDRGGGEPVLVDGARAPGIDGKARLLGWRPPGDDGLYVVVGASLDDRDETLGNLAALLAIGGPIALLIASGAGYLVAGRALAPVDAMRRRADEISASAPGDRLPVPAADDELRRLGETLNEMLARLEEAIERERRFVDDASHELRTPLALHKTELELALRYGEDTAEMRAAIASAIVEVDRLVQLAEDLLVVARTGDGELPLALEPLRVTDLLATVEERFRARAEGEERAISFAGAGDLRISADRLRVEQALTAMVDNALRHGAGRVSVRAERRDRSIAVHVLDDGPGFPPGFAERAFERFSRADEARGRGGTGLGLAIVRTIAGAHGGGAGARNRPDGGADVWIELPAPVREAA